MIVLQFIIFLQLTASLVTNNVWAYKLEYSTKWMQPRLDTFKTCRQKVFSQNIMDEWSYNTRHLWIWV